MAGADVENLDLQPKRTGSRFRLFHRRLGTRGSDRIDPHRHPSCSGHQLTKQPQSLCHQIGHEKIDPGRVAARPAQAVDKRGPERVLGNRRA
jgi:hypothetical protein